MTQSEQSIRGTILLFSVVRHILPEQQTRHEAAIVLSEVTTCRHIKVIINGQLLHMTLIDLEIYIFSDNSVIGILNTIITNRTV